MATVKKSHVTEEEENYLRMNLLLTSISPRAVRVLFDKEFHPSCLVETFKKERVKLYDLKNRNHVINAAQLNLLFPKRGYPHSKNFDVTLMIALLRNLTDLPAAEYEKLPKSTDITQTADLARIKHYRNHLAHMEGVQIMSTFFNTAWEDICWAVGRLGGQNMTQECETLRKRCLDQSTIPWHIRLQISKELEQWRMFDINFVKTLGAQKVLECIKENSCATITASFGAGKTATLRHVVLKMVDEGYDVLLVTHPEDIVKCNNSKKKTLFVIDDLCGTFSINESELEKWDSVINDIEELIQNKFHKIIVACRLQVFEDEKFESLSIFKTTVCNLLSKGLCLSKHERQLIAEMYLETKASDIIQYSNIFDCFPLLCKLYRDNPQLDITNFFQNPSSVYEAEIEQLKKNKHLGKYCALALCVMFNNEFPEAVLMNDINTNTRTIIENTFEACSLDKTTSRLLILNELILLKDTFIKEEHGVFKTVNGKIFNFLFYYFGKEMIKHLIINAHSEFIMERFLLEKEEHTDQLITIVPPRYHHLYIMRMFNDWSQGKVMHVFCNRNMKKTKFRHIYLLFLNILGLSHQKQLAQTCDINNKDTALLQCCFIGDVELVQWCCNQCVDVNMCGFNGMSPLFVSSQKGHTDIVQILLKNKADINRCDDNDASPLFVACQNNRVEIVTLLLDNQADINKCTYDETSPFFIACKNNHVDIVKLLLENKADINMCSNNEISPLYIACQKHHIEIVKLLLANRADANKCKNGEKYPLFIACENNYVEIVKLLLENEADINKCRENGVSPIYIACHEGHVDIVKILLAKGADCNNCVSVGESLLSPKQIANIQGYNEIVSLIRKHSRHDQLV